MDTRNSSYFDKVSIGQQFRYDSELFVKTDHTLAWSIRNGARFKEWAFHSDDVVRVIRKLYVDDLRPCPEGWDVARRFHDAIVMMEATDYDEVSLDHDIDSFYGLKELTGRDVLNWMIVRKVDGVYPSPTIVRVHSANPVGSATMRADIQRYWGT